MDLLTQPLHQVAPSRAPAPHEASSPHNGGTHAHAHRPVNVDDSVSIETSSTSASEHHQQTANQFAQLRTAPPAQAPAGLDNEPRIVAPSLVNGDWRVHGRVKAQCIFWHEGTLREKGLGANWKKSRDRLADVHEWVADGTLWITKTGEIVFVLDPYSSPTLVDRPAAATAKSKSALGRTSSEVSDTASGGTRSRRLSLSSLRRSTSRDSGSAAAAAAETTSEQPTTAAGAGEENQGGIRGLVKKIVSAISPSSRNKDLPAEEETSTPISSPSDLRRISTHESESTAPRARPDVAAGKQAEVAPVASETAAPGSGGGAALQFEEPEALREGNDPLPAYKGHAITALLISSGAHIRSIRHFPHRPADSTSPSSLPLSSTELQDLIDVGGEKMYPPVVELDVAAWVAPSDKKEAFEQENALIRKREVTIGFAFRDVLLLHEADDFRTRVEALVAAAPSADHATTSTPTFGASLMRTISGRSLGRTTSNEPAPAPAPPVGIAPATTQPHDQQQQQVRPGMPVQGRRSSKTGSWLKARPQGDVWT
ncbi:hypothetical protein JCM10908_005020 [Rhodotorula pacifica]|uniref:uncharacterized protein n=1 Tax=Rhodotorula pacifica TaxID=1495444 RepID=UPI00317067BB